MNPDKKQTEEPKTKADAIETPPPPQHIDPSKNPETGKSKSTGKQDKKK